MMPSKLDAAAALESMDSMDALQSKPLTMIPDEMRPAFDYSGLDEQTVDDLHFAEKEYQHGKKLAERGLVHMGNAIAAAHDALCGTVVQQLDNGQSLPHCETSCHYRSFRIMRQLPPLPSCFTTPCPDLGQNPKIGMCPPLTHCAAT